MFTTHPSRRALSRIHAAIQNVAGYGWADDNGGGGGGNPDPKPEPKPDPKPKPVDDGKGGGLTEEQVQARIAEALADADRKAKAKAEKETADREAEEAKKRGEFEKLAEREKARAEKAEAEAKSLRLRDSLRSYIDADKPELVKAAPLIAKLIDPAAADDDSDKAIRAAVAEYEKSLPEKAKGSAAAPAGPARTANRAAVANTSQNNDRPARRFRTLSHPRV